MVAGVLAHNRHRRDPVGPCADQAVEGVKKKGAPWQPMRPGFLNPPMLDFSDIPPEIQAAVRKAMAEDKPRQVWVNDRYVVQVIDREHGITELSIRRTDREYPRDWRHFQRIKNEICGPEREAVELFPAESRLIDGANQFHLWVLPEGMRFDLGYDGPRSVADGDHPALKGLAGKQRPLKEMS